MNLWIRESCTHAEIAHRPGWALGTVTRLRRALAVVRRDIEHEQSLLAPAGHVLERVR